MDAHGDRDLRAVLSATMINNYNKTAKEGENMEFNGVFHQAYDNYCYPLNEDELIINIKTGYDVKKVNIILGDPFAAGILGGGETWNGDKQPIIFKKKLKHQIWWTTTVKPQFKRLKYYFELITEDERWFYFEDGFVSAEQMALEGRSRQYFAQLAVLFAMPGSPCIYYGTEIAMPGSYDPDCRRCMPWDDIEAGRFKERIEMVSKLIHLRASEPLLKGRNFHFPDDFADNPRVIQFRKMGWVDTYVEVIVNCSDEDIEVPKDGEVLFERHCIDTTLLTNGILIRKIVGNGDK